MLNQQRQSATALGQQAADLAATTRQQMEGMAAEQRAELTRLSNPHMEAQNRQRMAESALVGLRDVALEHRNFIGGLAARQGVVTNNIDARPTTTNNYNNQMTDINVYNQVMNLLHTHSSQFGAYMQQRQLSDEQMQRVLYEHLRRGSAAVAAALRHSHDSAASTAPGSRRCSRQSNYRRSSTAAPGASANSNSKDSRCNTAALPYRECAA